MSRESARTRSPGRAAPATDRARACAGIAPHRSKGRRARAADERSARHEPGHSPSRPRRCTTRCLSRAPGSSSRTSATSRCGAPIAWSGDASGDALNRSFWYDGKTFSALDKEQNVWAAGEVPPTVDEALDWVFEQTGTVIPLADFLYADAYARLMEDVQRGVYLGDPRGGGRAVPPPVVRAGHHRLAALDRCRAGAAAAQAGDHLQDRGRGAAVHGDDPQVEPPGEAAGRALRVHAARGRHARRCRRVRRAAGRAHGRRRNDAPTDGRSSPSRR